MDKEKAAKKLQRKGNRKASYRVFLNELLDGSFLTKDVMRRNAYWFLLVVGLIIA
jgi:hypothetical protein